MLEIVVVGRVGIIEVYLNRTSSCWPLPEELIKLKSVAVGKILLFLVLRYWRVFLIVLVVGDQFGLKLYMNVLQ